MKATGPAGVATHIIAGSNFDEVINHRAWFCGTPKDTVADLEERQDQLTCFAEEVMPAFQSAPVSA